MDGGTGRAVVAEFDALPAGRARTMLLGLCASPDWADALVAGRPYRDLPALLDAADTALAHLDEAAIDDALAGHPRIGERSAHASSRREQSAVTGAGSATLDALAEGNRAYEERFGHVYLVCADGLGADELLAVLHERLANDPATERRVLRTELGRINRLRLTRLAG